MRIIKGVAISILVLTGVAVAAPAFGNSGGGSYQRSTTGPGGRSWSSNGSATYGNGAASGNRTITAPNGQTVTRQSNGTYGGGSASGNRTTTGPNGQSVTSSGSAQR